MSFILFTSSFSLPTAIGNLLCTLPHYLSDPVDTSDILIKSNKTNQLAKLGKFVCSAGSDGQDNIRQENDTSYSCKVNI